MIYPTPRLSSLMILREKRKFTQLRVSKMYFFDRKFVFAKGVCLA